MASLELLLYPLTADALPCLAVFWDSRDPAGSAERVRERLLQQGVIDDAVTPTHISNVFDKLRATRPDLLPLDVPLDMPRLRCLTAQCHVCQQPVTPIAEVRARMLTLQKGLAPIIVEEGLCRGCDARFSGCWILPVSGGLQLAMQPSETEPFLVQPARSAIAAIEPALLRLCSSLVVRLHGSFAGIVKVIRDMSGTDVSHQLRNELFHGWMCWSVLGLLYSARSLPALQAAAFFVSHHLRAKQQEWLGAVLPLLKERHAEKYLRQHRCDVCRQASTIGFDVKVGFSSALCKYAHGGQKTYPLVQQSIAYGCTQRPAVGSTFCQAHSHMDANPAPAVTCPAEHPLVYVALDPAWHHVCDVCAVALTSPCCFWTCNQDACDFDVCQASVRRGGPSPLVCCAIPSNKTVNSHFIFPSWLLLLTSKVGGFVVSGDLQRFPACRFASCPTCDKLLDASVGKTCVCASSKTSVLLNQCMSSLPTN